MNIYTVIPRALGRIETWKDKIPYAFQTDSILLQPVSSQGPSQSPYAADNPFVIDTQVASSLDEIIKFGQENKIGIGVDLVFNHVHPQGSWAKAHPEFVEWNEDGSVKHNGCPETTWYDTQLLNHTHPNLLEELLEYANHWAKIPAQTGGIIRLDNLHSTPKHITKEVISLLKQNYPNVRIIGEYIGGLDGKKETQELGVDSFLSWAYGEHWCNDLYSHLKEIHESDIPHHAPLTTHDTPSVEEMYGRIEATIPRFAISALMNNGDYGSTMWNEYGHPKQIPFIGANVKPLVPEKRIEFTSYFQAINEHAKDFTGKATFTNYDPIIKVERNGQTTYINLSHDTQIAEDKQLPANSTLVENQLYHIENGQVKQERYYSLTG